MALKLDGLAVLRAITAAPEAFPSIRAEITKAAGTLAIKQLKAAKLDLATLRGVRSALGADLFAMVAEALKDTEVKTIVGRLDKHNTEAKDAAAAERRRHLLALADSREPIEKPRRASPAKAPRAAAAPRQTTARRATRPAPAQQPAVGLESAAMSAVSPRRRKREES